MRFVIIALALLVAGCTQYTLIKPQRVAIGDAFTVEPDVAWNRFNPQGGASQGRVEIWTADGQTLNMLTFFAGIENGNPLYPQNAEQQKRNKLPEFRSEMTATDIMELVEATTAMINRSTLTTTRNLRPAKFGGVDGFRFEMSYVANDEVDREASAIGAVRDGRLYMIIYSGTRLHYHGLRQPHAERVIESARFTGS